MKSLLMMDCYTLWRQLKLFLVVVLLYAVGALVSGAYEMLSFSFLFLCMLPYYLVQLTPDTLFLILPCTRRQIVQERYLSILLSLLPSLLLSVACVLAGGSLLIPVFQIAACLTILAVLLPLVLRFGPVKARLFTILTVALFFGSSGAIVGGVMGTDLKPIESTLSAVSWATLGGSLILLGISYLISLRIYEKREY